MAGNRQRESNDALARIIDGLITGTDAAVHTVRRLPWSSVPFVPRAIVRGKPPAEVRAQPWHEVFLGGTVFAERELIRRFMFDVQEIQGATQQRQHAPRPRRGFHAKMLVGISNATLRVAPSIPDPLHAGFLRPGAAYPAVVRFSNQSNTVGSDRRRNGRGIAVRVVGESGRIQDLLMSNSPTSHARDALQFMIVGKAVATSAPWSLFPRLVLALGITEAVRVATVFERQTSRKVESLAAERYWSRVPFKLGAQAVKYQIRPSSALAGPSLGRGDDYLRDDLVRRLRDAPVEFELCLQEYVNEIETPIEDASIEWRETVSPPRVVGTLVLPRQDVEAPESAGREAWIDSLEFNPWNTTEDFRPLGSMNRARKFVYKASAACRGGREKPRTERAALEALTALGGRAFQLVNVAVPWHRLPPILGALNLLSYRKTLRAENLYDTDDPLATFDVRATEGDLRRIYARDSDGVANDLGFPEMGAAGRRLGRNVPRQYTYPEPEPRLLTPSPREVSRHLLARTSFIPAESLNLLAAAWIQFQTHDWFAHQRPQPGNEIELPLAPGDDWPERPAMRIRRTPADARSDEESRLELPPTYTNRDSHWWDGSQIYGSDAETTNRLRSHADGKLKLDDRDHFLLIDPETKLPLTGFNDNWWIGLHVLHTLFAREHNAICDHLRLDDPYWSDDKLFDTARLVNVALMAKIHTVDWTPAILSHPTLKIAMNANWWGLATERVHRLLGRLSDDEAISGIPGSPVDHQGIPFSLTEEFVSVYRLHPLIPDDLQLRRAETGLAVERLPFADLAFERSQKVFDGGASLSDVLYSFGVAHPGAMTLHNHPEFLRNLTLPDGQRLDLAAVDIMRDRERGVPRYNTFRKLLHMPEAESFEELTGNRQWAEELQAAYGDVNRVDLLVGMLAEQLPKGFGFSDTAFRIFILMASRRLKSDRFFTTDFRPEIYTQAGMAWIESNGMSSVLLRHCPELRPALRGVPNPFAPWNRLAE